MHPTLKKLNQMFSNYKAWKVGMRLEAVDRANPHLTCVASVLEVVDDQVTITFDGWGNGYDYTTEASNDDLHPIGYCQFNETERVLQPPMSKIMITRNGYSVKVLQTMVKNLIGSNI